MKNVINCGHCKSINSSQVINEFARYKCNNCNQINEITNVELKAWLGFNYKQYIKSIDKFISQDKFKDLAGKTAEEIARGKFSQPQIIELKKILKTSFTQGKSIRDIRDKVLKNTGIKDLKVVNSDGDVTRTIPKEYRSLNIARTESTRVANGGAMLDYKDAGISQYRWIAALSDRTCPECEELNGQVFEMGDGEQPPAHSLCRCTTGAITRFG